MKKLCIFLMLAGKSFAETPLIEVNDQKGDVQYLSSLSDKGELIFGVPLGRTKIGGVPIILKKNFGQNPTMHQTVPGATISLLDSFAEKIAEDRVRVLLPNGETITLGRRPNGRFVGDGWTGEIDDEKFLLNHEKQMCSFSKGRIISWQDEGVKLNWDYDEKGRVSTVSEIGGPSLKVDYSDEKIEFSTGGASGSVKWSVIDTLESNSDRYEFFLDEVKSLDGDVLRFDTNQDVKDVGSIKINGGSGCSFFYQYKLSNGEILEMNGSRFNVTRVKGADTPRITRIDANSNTVIQEASSNHLYEQAVYFLNGDVEKKVFVNTPGGVRLRKIIKIVGGEESVCYVAYYDEKGKILRDVSGKIERRFSDDGKVSVFRDGELLRMH